MNNTTSVAPATEQAGMRFRLESFEWQVVRGNNEDAARELLSLLQMLDTGYAQWGDGFSA